MEKAKLKIDDLELLIGLVDFIQDDSVLRKKFPDTKEVAEKLKALKLEEVELLKEKS